MYCLSTRIDLYNVPYDPVVLLMNPSFDQSMGTACQI